MASIATEAPVAQVTEAPPEVRAGWEKQLYGLFNGRIGLDGEGNGLSVEEKEKIQLIIRDASAAYASQTVTNPNGVVYNSGGPSVAAQKFNSSYDAFKNDVDKANVTKFCEVLRMSDPKKDLGHNANALRVLISSGGLDDSIRDEIRAYLSQPKYRNIINMIPTSSSGAVIFDNVADMTPEAKTQFDGLASEIAGEAIQRRLLIPPTSLPGFISTAQRLEQANERNPIGKGIAKPLGIFQAVADNLRAITGQDLAVVLEKKWNEPETEQLRGKLNEFLHTTQGKLAEQGQQVAETLGKTLDPVLEKSHLPNSEQLSALVTARDKVQQAASAVTNSSVGAAVRGAVRHDSTPPRQ